MKTIGLCVSVVVIGSPLSLHRPLSSLWLSWVD